MQLRSCSLVRTLAVESAIEIKLQSICAVASRDGALEASAVIAKEEATARKRTAAAIIN